MGLGGERLGPGWKVRPGLTVSALISNYNYGRYLAPAVTSVLTQSMPVSEVVVVDDGSTDGSQQILKELARLHARVVPVFQANGGQAAAINAGLARCTGDVICLLDADDLWCPTKVENVATAFADAPDAVMVMHRYGIVDSNGVVLHVDGTGKLPGGDLGPMVVRTGGSWFFGATSSLTLRRMALEVILPIPAENWRLCADGAIAYPAAFLGKVVSLDAALGWYRVHGSNNHFNAGLKPEKVQADVEMTNLYLNDFLARIGRPERVDLSRNLGYRRDNFYRHGGRLKEAWAITKLIGHWPLYNGLGQRAKFVVRFWVNAVRRWGLDCISRSERNLTAAERG